MGAPRGDARRLTALHETRTRHAMTAALWLLLLVPLVIGIVARRRLRRVYARYRRVPNRAGATGAQLARAMLDAHGLRRVGVETAPGVLTDHYDARAGVVRLSDAVAQERSVVSLAVAAHEAAHAYQDAEGSRAYRIRRSVGEPLARAAPWSGFFFIGGFFFGVPVLMYLSLAYVAGLVTLRPRDATRRARRQSPRAGRAAARAPLGRRRAARHASRAHRGRSHLLRRVAVAGRDLPRARVPRRGGASHGRRAGGLSRLIGVPRAPSAASARRMTRDGRRRR